MGCLFTDQDPFFFLDIDKCMQPDNTGSQTATDMCAAFAGAAVEVSQSGKGLHIFGRGTAPVHGCRNIPLGLEFYTESRFVALTGISALGDANTDCTAVLSRVVPEYFPPSALIVPAEWSEGPVPEWRGPESDDE